MKFTILNRNVFVPVDVITSTHVYLNIFRFKQWILLCVCYTRHDTWEKLMHTFELYFSLENIITNNEKYLNYNYLPFLYNVIKTKNKKKTNLFKRISLILCQHLVSTLIEFHSIEIIIYLIVKRISFFKYTNRKENLIKFYTCFVSTANLICTCRCALYKQMSV